jgi:uncharacterized secreted protein with C-terminal beta-propeller domain
MKKTNLILFFAIVFTLAFTSCKSVQAPKYTSVENLFNLKTGNTYEETVNILGQKPYDIYMSQAEGYTIYTYKYKHVERKINPNSLNQRGGETTGREVYNGKEQTAYLLFKNNKLESIVTSNGRKDASAMIYMNNTLYTISKDKEKYTILPSRTDEPISSVPVDTKKKKFPFNIFPFSLIGKLFGM